jgi:predicted HicB family RNase H-like nuclease
VTRESDSASAIKSGVNRYAYRVQWSPDYNQYVGVCIELPYLRREAETAEQAVAAIEQATREHVDAMRTCGEAAPTPLCERNYSGTFLVRTSPELHARLALEASEERVSMNQWVVQNSAAGLPATRSGFPGSISRRMGRKTVGNSLIRSESFLPSL